MYDIKSMTISFFEFSANLQSIMQILKRSEALYQKYISFIQTFATTTTTTTTTTEKSGEKSPTTRENEQKEEKEKEVEEDERISFQATQILSPNLLHFGAYLTVKIFINLKLKNKI